MREVILKALQIENFKGIKSLSIQFDGLQTDISGANATGKTTIKDAFLWLLFDKDSTGSTDFSWKPIDNEGREIHNLTTAAAASLEIDGKVIVIEKRSEENWVTKRGEKNPEYKGNVNEFFIDGVPVKKKEYGEFIGKIADEKIFRVLTDTEYFCGMKWQDRRKIVAEVCKLDTKPLTDATDEKKKLSAALKKANEEVEGYPIRIDEAMRSIKPVEKKQSDIEATLSENKKEREALNIKRNDILKTGGGEKIRSEISKLTTEKKELESADTLHNREQESKHKQEKAAIESAVLSAEKAWKESKTDTDKTENQLSDAKIRRQSLRDTYDAEEAKAWNGATICPTCGHPLEADKIDAARKKFNADKIYLLESIEQKGIESAEEVKRLEKELEAATVKKEQLYKALSVALENKAAWEKQPIEGKRVSPRISEIDKEITRLNDLLKNDKSALDAELLPIDAEITELNKKDEEARQALADIKKNAEAEQRVAELTQKQTEAVDVKVKLEKQLIDIDEEIKAIGKKIQAAVAGRFGSVQFKLFEQQINGGIDDTCVPLINGVPFSDANHAAQINAGIEIIKALGAFYNVRLPVFVDNAEAVNEVQTTGGQIIRLVVTNDKKLKIDGGKINE